MTRGRVGKAPLPPNDGAPLAPVSSYDIAMSARRSENRTMASGRGVGASLPRKEDHRLLHGQGEFIADIAMPGAMDVAFVRSPLAHARIRSVAKPRSDEARVFTAADLAAVGPIVARSGLPGFKVSEQPVLAAGSVRYAGEPIAACLEDFPPPARCSRRSTTPSASPSRA